MCLSRSQCSTVPSVARSCPTALTRIRGEADAREGHMAISIWRREFVLALGGAATTWPMAARAHQPERMRRIGMLWITSDVDPQSIINRDAFNRQLHLLGWRPGDNVR